MFETSTHRGCVYIEQQSYELIERKGASHDYHRRHCHVDVPRGELRRRRGRRAHSLPDHAGADERPRGGFGQHAVEDLVPYAPCSDQPASRCFRLHRRGEGPRSSVARKVRYSLRFGLSFDAKPTWWSRSPTWRADGPLPTAGSIRKETARANEGSRRAPNRIHGGPLTVPGRRGSPARACRCSVRSGMPAQPAETTIS